MNVWSEISYNYVHVDDVDLVGVEVDTVTHKDPAIHTDREADGFLWE